MPPPGLRRALDALQRDGLLLAADAELPSVTTLVAGEPVRGSWWGHPRSHAIWATMEALEGHPEVVMAKLVSGKVTYVHRALWVALVAVGRAGEAWQTEPLSPPASRLWVQVKERSALTTDGAPLPDLKGRALGDVVRELERVLLVHSEEVHTAGGAHAKRLQTWERWAARHDLEERMETRRAKGRLEAALVRLNARVGGSGRLPWQDAPPRGGGGPPRPGR